MTHGQTLRRSFPLSFVWDVKRLRRKRGGGSPPIAVIGLIAENTPESPDKATLFWDDALKALAIRECFAIVGHAYDAELSLGVTDGAGLLWKGTSMVVTPTVKPH